MSFIDRPKRFLVRHAPGFEERLMRQDNPVILRRMLLRRVPSGQRDIVEKAANLAEEAFEKLPLRQEERQVVPVVHSYRVAIRYAQSNAPLQKEYGAYTAVALLHDTKEDTQLDQGRVAALSPAIASGVDMLTRIGEGPLYDALYYQKMTDTQVEIIKTVDRIENMEVFLRMRLDQTFGKGKVVKNSMWRNYQETEKYIVPMALGNEYARKGIASVLRRTMGRLQKAHYLFTT